MIEVYLNSEADLCLNPTWEDIHEVEYMEEDFDLVNIFLYGMTYFARFTMCVFFNYEIYECRILCKKK